MAKRKDYSLQADKVFDFSPKASIPWEIKTAGGTFDFKRWLFLGRPKMSVGTADASQIRILRDDIVIALRNAVWRLGPSFSDKTIRTLCASGISTWFGFLDCKYESGVPILGMADITTALIEEYIKWLRFRSADTATKRLSYSSAKSTYSQTKSVLSECVNVGLLQRGIFPKNPFPNSNRAKQSYKSYSRDEMVRLMKALSTDLLNIRGGSFSGTESDRLAVYFFLIAARTGRNPTPLLEAERNALRPHPLNPKTKALLVLYKKRGNNVSLQSFRKSCDVEGIATVQSDVATLFSEVLKITEIYVPQVPANHRNRLWLCRREAANQHRGLIAVMDGGILHNAGKRLVKRHDLKSDALESGRVEKAAFQLTTMRLRKTFATRMWQLSGGDLIKTAQALGNTPSISDMHYLEVTPEMERQHKFVGHCLEATLRGLEHDAVTISTIASEMKVPEEEVVRILNGKNNTGVGRCTSPFFGEYAPKDGKNACTSFLYCFRCPNQVVMEADLYRLFSFYWLIIKERNFMDRTKWKRVYGWVLREIDGDVCSKFSPQSVKDARDVARANPHPMWRDRALLGGAYA